MAHNRRIAVIGLGYVGLPVAVAFGKSKVPTTGFDLNKWDATSTEGSEVRSLRIGQRVDFDVAQDGGASVARSLHLVTFA